MDETPSVFVPKRLTIYNIIIANENYHSFKNKRTSSQGLFALNLGMSKVYDLVEQHFLENMMLIMVLLMCGVLCYVL